MIESAKVATAIELFDTLRRGSQAGAMRLSAGASRGWVVNK